MCLYYIIPHFSLLYNSNQECFVERWRSILQAWKFTHFNLNFQPLRYTGEGTEERALPKKTDRKKRNAIVEIRDREIKQQRYVTQRPWRRARGLGRKKKIPSIFTINSCSGRKTQIKTRNSSLKFCFNGLFFAFSGVESTQIVRNLRTGFSDCTLTYSS